jgi:anti-sigma regulatory factor (Ser/Thr protein kinase)
MTFARAWLHARDATDFELCIGEALANAVEHGGGATMAITCERDGGRVVVEIADCGPGFEWRGGPRLPDASGCGGYGLYIMHQLLDELEVLDGGRRLRLVKRTSLAVVKDSDDELIV